MGWKDKTLFTSTGELYVGLFLYLTEWLDKWDMNMTLSTTMTMEDHKKLTMGYYHQARLTECSVCSRQKITNSLQFIQHFDLTVDLYYHPLGLGNLHNILYVRWHLAVNRQILIIVPTTSLVEQLYKDLKSMG